MGTYINPIPSMDDEEQARIVTMQFLFEKPVTRHEAAENLNLWFKNNKIEDGAIKLVGEVGTCYKRVQKFLGKNDRDPDGYGPRPAIKP